MTDRTVRHEYCGVAAIRLAAGNDCGAIDIDGGALAAVGGQAVKVCRSGAEAASRDAPAQGREGKIAVLVFRRRMPAIDGDMGDAQVVAAGGGGRIDLIELGGRVVGSARSLVALVPLMGSRRGDQRHPALRQRLRQQPERHFVKMRPFIGRAVAERLVIGLDAREIRDWRVN